MSNVRNIFPANNIDLVLENAKGSYESAIVIGYNRDGRLQIYGGGMIDGRQPTVKDWLFMVESFKLKLLNGDYCD